MSDRPQSPRFVDGAQGSAQGGTQWGALMARAQQGDRAAYERLLREVVPYLRRALAHRCAGSADLEDRVQDVLLTVHAIRATYDPSRPFKPWLIAIARRRVVDHLRRHGRIAAHETVLDESHETIHAGGTNTFDTDTAEGALALRDVEAAIEGLPPGQRQAVRLLKLEGLSLEEASVRTGATVGSLKVASHRAVQALKRLLGSHD